MSSFSGLLNNAVLLLALGVIYDAIGLYKIRTKMTRDLLSGLLVGLVGMAVMLTPWALKPGIFFDTRWILLSLCALFFGLVPTLVAVIMTVALRLFQGGGGAIVGSLVIIVTSCVGLFWRKLVHDRSWHLSWWNLYLFGVLVQLAMLSCMFLMPADVRFKILAAVAPPILAIYPIGTTLLGLVLRRQRDRRSAEMALEEHRQLLDRERGLLNGLINSIPDIIFYKDTEGKYLGCNKAFERIVGISQQEVLGKTDLDLFDAETAKGFQQQDQQVISSGEPYTLDEWIELPNGKRRMISKQKVQFRGIDGTLHGLAGISRDITERWTVEEERRQLQEQLAQAQKMESVGQLAGGIAHDFNNMLAVILGQTELAKLRLDNNPRLETAIDEIQRAAKRSADLTQQLLAFARKQAVTPKVLDLNASVSGMCNILQRLIGENIELSIKPGDGLWPVKMDPSQLDQVLTNFSINARDAIEGQGKLTIETSNVSLDEDWCKEHENLLPGDYVIISINDNGLGMSPEICQKIFDPFFTTKKTGEGTGLGLATVYGIIKQNKGLIDVSSEPGQGTTFKIYLPRAEGSSVTQLQTNVNELQKGEETILLVEDEESLLKLTKEMLESLGYKVLSANNPRDGLEIATNFPDSIELLLTDVVMPGTNGLELSKQLLEQYPNVKVLFMSGYTADVIAKHGILDEEIVLLEKPFSMLELSHKLREALDEDVV